MNPRVHVASADVSLPPPAEVDPPTAPEFSPNYDIQDNPFFCFTTPTDFSSSNGDSDVEFDA